ncbi:MAG: formylglycine-generating enzyme family protein [Chloroflexi bacterium]|nr:formylglycine-generating enzyme family protein [Chloroflexota bacterium]
MKLFKNRKLGFILILSILISMAGFSIWNLDILLRFYHSYQNGTLNMEKFRLDIASYNIGRRSPVTPIYEKRSAKDGMMQVYVPEGEFLMGKGDAYKNADSPQHAVFLDAFWIDKVEVSNAMYIKCMQAGFCTELVSDNIYYQNWVYRDHPITYVTWVQANEYCQWAGRRLPTEAEWEKAARGTDGRMYPWGDEAPNPRLANFSGSLIHEAVSVYRYPLGASPYGALNMSGNAREWVADWYDLKYYLSSPRRNPAGPEMGLEKSMRSGSYNEDGREIAVTHRYRHEPQSAGLSRGFRCAQDENSEYQE